MKYFTIIIDQKEHEVEVQKMTGKQLLELVKKSGEDWKLFLVPKTGEKPVHIELDQEVDITSDKTERFLTIPTQQKDGENRREFQLPKNEQEDLNSRNFSWETLLGVNHNWLIIHDYKIPKHYCHDDKVSLAIEIPTTSRAALKMAYFYPYISRIDGQRIPAVEGTEKIDGKDWQGWSRHPETVDGTSKTEEDKDRLLAHLCQVDAWLENEFIRTPHETSS